MSQPDQINESTSGVAMEPYRATRADLLGLPERYHVEERYIGYREADFRKPYAHYFKAEPLPIQPHVRAALKSGPVPADHIVPIAHIAAEMSRPGYLALETGVGVGVDGTACVACLTDMPGVDPVMWEWWFGWHIQESARYKLWHPTAHVFTMPGEQRSHDHSLTDRQKYIGNVSYIDEYIGNELMRLAVRFVAPSVLGFNESESDSDSSANAGRDNVTIAARGGPSLAPVTAVWLIHQLRRTACGSEMRSRFYLGPPVPLNGLAPVAASVSNESPSTPGLPDLLEHCATEMNHLASFLPDLYREFGKTASARNNLNARYSG